jgi:hypothetical protein
MIISDSTQRYVNLLIRLYQKRPLIDASLSQEAFVVWCLLSKEEKISLQRLESNLWDEYAKKGSS